MSPAAVIGPVSPWSAPQGWDSSLISLWIRSAWIQQRSANSFPTHWTESICRSGKFRVLHNNIYYKNYFFHHFCTNRLRSNFKIQLILLNRTPAGAVYYKYLGHDQDIAYETWSSSKIFAMANAAGWDYYRTIPSKEKYFFSYSYLRETCNVGCGLEVSTQGSNGETPLGDLATIVCSYDETQVIYYQGIHALDKLMDCLWLWIFLIWNMYMKWRSYSTNVQILPRYGLNWHA